MTAPAPAPVVHATREVADRRIQDLATELYPLDGYESDEENATASLFILLCQAVRLYAEDGTDIQTTLDAIGENLID